MKHIEYLKQLGKGIINREKECAMFYDFFVDRKCILFKNGDKNNVKFDIVDKAKVIGTSYYNKVIAIHNHPISTELDVNPQSFNDVALMIEWRLKEIWTADKSSSLIFRCINKTELTSGPIFLQLEVKAICDLVIKTVNKYKFCIETIPSKELGKIWNDLVLENKFVAFETQYFEV